MKIDATLIIFILLSVLITFLGLLISDEQSRTLYFSVLSAVSAIFTIFVAWAVYDKFDSRKLAFGKQTQAVDDLASSLVFKRLTLTSASPDLLDAYRENAATPLLRADFYLNWSHLNNSIFKERELPVYFTQQYVDLMKDISKKALDPWLPSEIRESLKGLVLFNGTTQFLIGNRDFRFIVVSEYNMIPDSTENFYTLGYDERKIQTTKQMFTDWNKILKSIQDWYQKNLGVHPDFNGH